MLWRSGGDEGEIDGDHQIENIDNVHISDNDLRLKIGSEDKYIENFINYNGSSYPKLKFDIKSSIKLNCMTKIKNKIY